MGGSIETTISFYKIKKGKGGKMGRFMKFTIRGVLRGVCSRILPRIAASVRGCNGRCGFEQQKSALEQPSEASTNRKQLT